MLDDRKLWTTNFRLLTAGSFITYMGTAATAYVVAFLLLETYDSVLIYSLYLGLYNAVRLIAPLLAGAYLDRCSRKKVAYSINLVLSGSLIVFWSLYRSNYMHFWWFFILAIVVGMTEGCYKVSYKSLYPLTIEKAFLPKANAIVTALETISAVMIPIGTILYKTVGFELVMIICSLLFLFAGIIEMFIKQSETFIVKTDKITFKSYITDFKQGLSYIFCNKALLYIVIFEFALYLIWGTENTIILPFCYANYNNGYLWYILISGALMTGEFWGSCIMYVVKISPRKAYIVYLMIALFPFACESVALLLPIWLMVAVNLLFGTTSAISENLRFATSQAIIPEELRGRFNGVYSTMMYLGMLVGQLMVGILSRGVSLQATNVIIGGTALFIQIVFCVIGRASLKEHFLQAE